MMSNESEKLPQFYNQHLNNWESLLFHISETIGQKLREAELKFTPKFRVKSLESLNAKKQYLTEQGLIEQRPIKDLLGLRFIVPFLEDVEHVTNIVKELYEVVDVERKSEALSYREFAYDSVHLEIFLADNSVILPEFCGRSCEIQIRTILQDAWAEVEHELVYKNSIEFPNSQSIRKKMAALNASLSLSDMIFQEIRDKQKELVNWGHERFQELQNQAKQISVETLPKYLFEKEETPLIEGHQEKVSFADIEDTLFKALDAHNQEHYRTAIELYTKALHLEPPLNIRAILYNHRGLAYIMMNQEQQALKDFEKSIHCDPSYYRALNNRALALRRMGLTNEALYNFNKSLELDAAQEEVYYLRAQTYYETQNYPNAFEDIEQALEINPDYTDAIELKVLIEKRLKELKIGGKKV